MILYFIRLFIVKYELVTNRRREHFEDRIRRDRGRIDRHALQYEREILRLKRRKREEVNRVVRSAEEEQHRLV